MSDVVISVEGLRKSYGAVEALRGIDLAVRRGGIVGILGPNGAGKTTLVETIEGLRAPTSGRVSVLGLDPAAAPRAVKERIGVQLQTTVFQTELTALEIVRLYARLYRRARSPREVLGSVGLEDKAKARAGTLSGGQKQRLALALALVHDPEVVLLDEPTTGLDPAARRSLHGIVRDLAASGRTVLLTTHYIEEAEALCDRVVVLRSGRIVADGAPFDLLQLASGVSTLWIAADGPLDPAPLLAAGCLLSSSGKDHLRFTTHDPTTAVLALGELLRAQGIRLTDVRLRRPTLEDVYLELVGPEGRGEEAAP